MAFINFDATHVDPTVSRGILPAGHYVVEITASSSKETKAKNGSYLELEMTILEGDFKGYKLWDRLCLNHVNAKTQRIAQANLSAICHAVKVLQPQDSIELHHIPFMVTVRNRADKNTGDMSLEVRGYARRDRQLETTNAAIKKDDSAPWAR